eukprot:g643.t1
MSSKDGDGSNAFSDFFAEDTLKRAHSSLDQNKDGKIDAEDFGRIMTEMGETTSRKASLEAIKRIDKESEASGMVSFSSFIAMLNMDDKMSLEKCAEEVFRIFDEDSSGNISAENIVSMFEKDGKKISVADAQQIIKIIGGGDSLDVHQFKEVAMLRSTN